MPRSTENEARAMIRDWNAAAIEMDERECGPEAEHLRAQAGAMLYAQPELFHHVQMDRKPVKRHTIGQRIRRFFKGTK